MTIRKTLLAAGTLAALAVTPAAAQSAWGGEVGIKGGLSFGNISNKGVLPGSLKTRTGLAGGLYFGYSAPVVGIGFEALYAQRGLRSDESISVAETRLDYIDIPAYLKINIPTSGVRPFLYAGPQISFEVRCRTGAGAECADGSPRKSTDYAAVIGAGLRLGSGTGITLEGRYVYGLQDLKLSTLTSSDSYKHRTFMLLVGIGKELRRAKSGRVCRAAPDRHLGCSPPRSPAAGRSISTLSSGLRGEGGPDASNRARVVF